MRALVALAAVISLGGCSYFNVKGPRTTAPPLEEEVDCTEESRVPEFDVGGAVGSAILGTIGCIRLHGAHDDGLFMCPLLLVGILDGVSAAYGFRDLKRCKEANAYQDDMRKRMVETEETKRSIEIRQQAHDLTEQAAAAARDDDCATVWDIERTLSKLDDDFYRTVFRNNIAIKHCLSPVPGKYRTTGVLDGI